MKRSEMVQKLAYLVSEHCFIHEDCVGINRKDASLFLAELEKHMIPDFIGVGEEDHWGYLDYANKWDEE